MADKLEALSLHSSPAKSNLEDLSPDQLLQLRRGIDQLLNLTLGDLNMKEELAVQLMHAKALYHESADAPANQKAQVLNTISSVIASISKTSAEVYSVERLKRIEAATLAAVGTLNSEAKTKFFDLYREYLEKGSV